MESRLTGRHVTLAQPPRESEARKKRRQKKVLEKAKLEQARARGLKTRGILSRKTRESESSETGLTWQNMLPLHYLWLGYMSELFGIPLQGAQTATEAASGADSCHQELSPKPNPVVQALVNDSVRRSTWQTSLTKADFHGCILSGRWEDSIPGPV